jgi:hypothetical protein
MSVQRLSVAKTQPPSRKADEPYIWPVVDEHLATLNSIASGLALIDSLIGADAGPATPVDILAGEFPETREILRPIRILAEILVEGIANVRAHDSRANERSDAMDAIDSAVQQARLRITRRIRNDALGDAAEVIREMGLEFHDLSCILATDPNGKDVILVDPVSPQLAHAWLIERLLRRADTFVAVDENLSIERTASAWFFDCWSDGTQDGEPSHTDFSRLLREQEWSLVSRDTLSLDEPVISSFTTDQQPDDVPPRQQRLATAYERSTVGIFEVMAVDGPHVTFRDTSTGHTHRYYEHNEDANPYPGLLILGRMIPLEDDLWLRSPGAIILTSVSDDFRDRLSTDLTSLSEGLPTPIALEAMISMAAYGAMVPVARLAAPTIEAAHAALAAIDDMLEAIGLYEIDDHQIATDDFERRNAAELEQFEQRVDQPVAEWIAALTEQVDLETPRPDAQTAKRKKRRRAKQQHSRRRKR